MAINWKSRADERGEIAIDDTDNYCKASVVPINGVWLATSWSVDGVTTESFKSKKKAKEFCIATLVALRMNNGRMNRD